MNQYTVKHIQIVVASFIASWFVGVFDQHAAIVWHQTLVLYPIVLLGLYFFSRYYSLQWVVVGVSLFAYALVAAVPIIAVLIVLVSMVIADVAIQVYIQRVTVMYIAIMSVVVSLSLHIVSKITPWLLTQQGWFGLAYLWLVADLRDLVLKTVFAIVILLLCYPVLLAIDSRQKMYTSLYR